HLADVRTGAQAMGQRILVFPVSSDDEVETAFASMAQQGANALLVTDDAFFSSRRDLLITRANSRALPSIYYTRQFAAAGGLISHGSNRQLPPRRRLRRPYSQGHSAGRASGRAADQVRAGDQPEDRKSARSHRSTHAASGGR